MEFLILGPIEARNAAGAVALGGAKPRAVLAVLLLRANEPVSADRLALALWGEDAHDGAVKNVQVHVSRLRKALGDSDAAIVVTTPAGYVLRVGEDELDATRFERLVADAVRALDAGRPEDASRIADEALALYRGSPLADLELESFAGAEIARLEEQRLAALELRIRADLDAGRHAAIVAELRGLVADHPTREQLAGQLMLALYRCDRQTEALDAFATARRALVEQFGIEPGQRLRELHEAILRQDPELDVEPTDSELPAPLDPSEAPPLAGRDDELEWLLSRWERARTGAGAIVALTGPRGIGKSRLVAELAVAVRRPGVVIAHASGLGPADGILVALRRLRAGARPALLVIDDVDGAGPEALAELAELAARLGRAARLVVLCAQDAATLADLGAIDARALGPLDVDAVRAIAATYAPDGAADGIPALRLLEESAGVARRVHEVASQRARREAARRVGEAAGKAKAERERGRFIHDELAGGIERLQAADERLVRASEADMLTICPYKGLASFDVVDAPYFFGRERLVADLVARTVEAQLLGVVGPSGSGKSSVLRAGLLPALAAGVVPGSEDAAQVLIRPGRHPLRELAEGLARAGDAERIVIAVDQFEETFTNCEDEQERAAFIAELGAAAADGANRYLVLIALRADFYGRCAKYRELASPLAANNVLVHSMGRDELRRAIVLPAQRVGLTVDPDLTDALIADVNDEPGALPLLQTALLELWRDRDGRQLRHRAYARSGGIRGAVARLAEDAFGRLDERQQQLARGVLMRLAGESEAGGVERRRVPLGELELDRDANLDRAVALLTDARLLTASAGSIELAHEALLREWPRLRDWIAENRESLRVHRHVGAAAREWQALARDEGALYRGTRLIEALEWSAESPDALNEVERAFLAASETARGRERILRRRRIVAAISGLGTALVVVAIVAIVAVAQRRDAQRQRDIAASRALEVRSSGLLESNPRLGLTVALAALARYDDAETRAAVRQAALEDRVSAIAGGLKLTSTVRPSRDGRRLVTASDHGHVRVWNAATDRLESAFPRIQGDAVAADFSWDGSHVASASTDGTVVVSNARGGDRRTLLRLQDQDYVRSVQFTHDGRRLLVATSSGVVGFIPTDRRSARLVRLGAGKATRASMNEAGTRVVGGGDTGSIVWDLAGHRLFALPQPGGALDAEFSPDGRLIATAAPDGTVRIWSAADGRLVRVIRVGQDIVGSVRFSPDDQRIVTASVDGVVRISSVGGGPPLDEMRGSEGAVYDAAFLPGSTKVVSVDESGELITWTPSQVQQLHASGRAPYGQPSFSHDGRHVVSGYDDGSVHVWDPATGDDVALDTPGYDNDSVAKYSADGRYVLSANYDPSIVRLSDVRRPRSPARLVPAPPGKTGAIAIDGTGSRVAIAKISGDTVVEAPDGGDRLVIARVAGVDIDELDFSADGRRLASAGTDGLVRIWDASKGGHPREFDAGSNAIDVAFSPDDSHIAAAGADGAVRVWALTGGPPVLMYGHEGQVNTVAFDSTGRRVVSAGVDGTVRVWDAATGESLATVESYRGSAPGAAFSPTGEHVVSSGESEGTLRISRCELCGSFPAALAIARSRPPRALDPVERRVLLAGGG